MEEILLKLRRLTQQVKDSSAQTIADLKPTIDSIKNNFDEWKLPWTQDRAEKLDNLDVQVSTRSTQASVDELKSKVTTDLKPTIDGIKTNFDEWKVPWTADRAEKIDNLDVPVSTRASEATAMDLHTSLQESIASTFDKVSQLFPAGATKTFTTPGTHTFTVPAGTGIINVLCVGAGGGGGGGAGYNGNDYAAPGGGGGGGGKREGTISVTPGSKLTVVVGAGGAGGAGGTPLGASTGPSGNAGKTGGSSSLGGIVATGGTGGGGGPKLKYSSDPKAAGGAGGVSDGNPGTAGGHYYDDIGQGGAAPSVYGSYGRGGDGGIGRSSYGVASGVGEVGKAGSGGFVRITY